MTLTEIHRYVQNFMHHKMIYSLSHQFVFSNLHFFAILRTFSSITREICDEIKNKIHHVNQLIQLDLMIYIYITFIKIFHTTSLHSNPLHSTPLHSTELFKIFFSFLTFPLLFCKKRVGREKIITSTSFED